jgi:hypothetical protein
MLQRLNNYVLGSLVGVLVLLVILIFLNSPGTDDVALYWVPWADHAADLGGPAGFAIDEAQYGYPPYSSVILASAVRIGRALGLGTFEALKWSLVAFLVGTSALVWLWTRNFIVTMLFCLALLLNSVALGYIDIYFAPTLILALWALKVRKWLWFTVFFIMASLTKWQPIIIAPFIALYILDIQRVRQWRQIDFKKLVLTILLPAAAVLGLTLRVFDAAPLALAISKAFNNEFLSGNALNFSWIETHWLHVFYPEDFGPLIGGEAGYIVSDALRVTLLPKVLFFLTYAVALAAFFRREKTFENLINFSLIGYLAYFTFNTGVHENHLFLAAMLGVILFWLNRGHLSVMLILVLMSNVNLVLFFGIYGQELPFSRVIGGAVDVALLLSIFNVIFFLVLWGAHVLPRRKAAMAIGQDEGTIGNG